MGISTKLTDGFTNVPVTIFCLAVAGFNIFLLSLVFKALPIGIAYTVWVGLGVIGTLIASLWLFGEAIRPAQFFLLLLILIGIGALS